MFARYIYRHSRYFTLIIVCAVAVGINSFNAISRQEDPTLTNFVGNITTFYPGATPDRVEALITRPLEDELRTISEIEEVPSAARSRYASKRSFDSLGGPRCPIATDGRKSSSPDNAASIASSCLHAWSRRIPAR